MKVEHVQLLGRTSANRLVAVYYYYYYFKKSTNESKQTNRQTTSKPQREKTLPPLFA